MGRSPGNGAGQDQVHDRMPGDRTGRVSRLPHRKYLLPLEPPELPQLVVGHPAASIRSTRFAVEVGLVPASRSRPPRPRAARGFSHRKITNAVDRRGEQLVEDVARRGQPFRGMTSSSNSSREIYGAARRRRLTTGRPHRVGATLERDDPPPRTGSSTPPPSGGSRDDLPARAPRRRPARPLEPRPARWTYCRTGCQRRGSRSGRPTTISAGP